MEEPSAARAGRFFLSSRRRHTRWNCDWSSDVCSSDLGFTNSSSPSAGPTSTDSANSAKAGATPAGSSPGAPSGQAGSASNPFSSDQLSRSEERRVGKECRSAWAAYRTTTQWRSPARRALGVFFYQAEDGIRDGTVTGVQTCALPISVLPTVAVPRQDLPVLIARIARKLERRRQDRVLEPLPARQALQAIHSQATSLADRKSVV